MTTKDLPIQHAKYRQKSPIYFTVLICLTLFGAGCSKQSDQEQPTPAQTIQPVANLNVTSPTINTSSTSAPSDPYAALPDIGFFATHKTDQWLIDMSLVKSGHPYLGKNAAAPHSGAHVHFEDDWKQWPQGGTAPQNYPPIYAVADGVVNRITSSLRVGANDRYGINLAIAKEGNMLWTFEYSIEPFVPEPSPGFYLPFILVHEGQAVKKGDVIAYMYLAKNVSNGPHIHFELVTDQQPVMKVPAIFTPDLVQAFHDRWGGGAKDGGVTIPVCMGWKIQATEHPFANEAATCL